MDKTVLETRPITLTNVLWESAERQARSSRYRDVSHFISVILGQAWEGYDRLEEILRWVVDDERQPIDLTTALICEAIKVDVAPVDDTGCRCLGVGPPVKTPDEADGRVLIWPRVLELLAEYHQREMGRRMPMNRLPTAFAEVAYGIAEVACGRLPVDGPDITRPSRIPGLENLCSTSLGRGLWHYHVFYLPAVEIPVQIVGMVNTDTDVGFFPNDFAG